MNDEPLLQLDLPGIRKLKSGKVREVFDLGESLLFVATDRISAFDCIMPNGIPRKGEVLTQISHFWFAQTQALVPNHLLAQAGAFSAWEPDRRKAAWEALRSANDTLPLAPARVVEHHVAPLTRDELIALDYHATGVTINGHPMMAYRERLCAEILACARVGIGICSVEEIDSLNILQASMLAMERAVAGLLDPMPMSPDQIADLVRRARRQQRRQIGRASCRERV